MKAATVYRQQSHPSHMALYPNALSRRQIFTKVLDGVLIGACGFGICAMLLLLLVMI